jgi:hypothetical protein
MIVCQAGESPAATTAGWGEKRGVMVESLGGRFRENVV